MPQPLTFQRRQALLAGLAARGVTPDQFQRAVEMSRVMGEELARAYGGAVGRAVTPIEFATEVLGVEGSGRLLVCALREVTGRQGLYQDLL